MRREVTKAADGQINVRKHHDDVSKQKNLRATREAAGRPDATAKQQLTYVIVLLEEIVAKLDI